VTNSATDIERRFAEARPRLRVRRQRLIQAILETPDETFYLSSREMARRFEVDPATIVRTIQALGYERFADFSTDLRKHFVSRITPYTVMKATAREQRSIADHVRLSLARDQENLNLLAGALDKEKIQALSRQLHRSRRIVVVGVDLAAALAEFLAYALRVLGLDTEAPIGSAGNLSHNIKHLTSRDLVIAISFRRGLRETINSVITARKAGVPTFGITDSGMTPIAQYCDDYLIAPIQSPSFAGSYVAPMALLNTIVIASAHQNPARSLAILREHEEEYKSGARWFKEPSGSGGVNGRNSADPAPPASKATRRRGAARRSASGD
jgi:DNA-binding MurR/RpiR family transcriptional regulator